MVEFLRKYLNETTFEVLKIVIPALAAGSVCGLILSSVLNHEIAEMNSRATLEVPCP